MKTTTNFDLPILESGDKYSKDIQNEAFNRIDTEIYGISEAINETNVSVTELNKLAEDIEALGVEVKEQNNYVTNIVENIPKTNATAEVIEARGTYSTLKDKIGSIDSSLESIVNYDFVEKISSNKTLELKKDITLINTVELNNIENLKIVSLKGKTIIKGNIAKLFNITNCKNIIFENIIFNSENTSSSLYGSINIIEQAKNIKFINCDFSSLNSNAIKIIAETENKCVEDIYILDCVFENIGRMGVETQNHSIYTNTIKNIYVNACKFKNIGLYSNPMMCSFSGECSNINVKNCIFDNANNIENTIGIEGVGLNNSTIDNNYFIGNNMKFLSFTNERIMNNNKVTNNTTSETGVGYYYFVNQKNLLFNNNIIGNGHIYLTNCSNSKITNNYIENNEKYCIMLDNTSNTHSNNNTLISLSTSSWAVYRCYGVDSKYNTILNTKYSYKSGVLFDLNNNGASENYDYFSTSFDNGKITLLTDTNIKKINKVFSQNLVEFEISLSSTSGWTNLSFDLDLFLYMSSVVSNGVRKRIKSVINVNYHANTNLFVEYVELNGVSDIVCSVTKVNNYTFKIIVTNNSANSYVNCFCKLDDIMSTNRFLTIG